MLLSRGLILLLTVAAEGRARAQSSGTVDREDARRQFIVEMTEKHGFDAAELNRAFGNARFSSRIVALMNKQTKRPAWNDYRAQFVNEEKIRVGQRFWRQHAGSLAEARKIYGVPEEIIVAILAVETHYGKNTGGFSVLEALMTLSFDYPPRASQFRLELEHYLLLTREESMSLNAAKGSYAGAMGIAQFMPGSYRRYAVDFDRDGSRDLFTNVSDAVGSVANYITAHGWTAEGVVAVPAVVEDRARSHFESSRLSRRYSLNELRQAGVRLEGAFPGTDRAIPVLLRDPARPEYWLGFDNFYVITRYNRSSYYAMAVYQLSLALRERYDAIQAAAPDGPLGLP